MTAAPSSFWLRPLYRLIAGAPRRAGAFRDPLR